MAKDLSTKYMGLNLKNPIIASSSPFTSNIDSLKRLEDSGVSAVVLKSVFEEQINDASRDLVFANEEDFTSYEAAYDYLMGAGKEMFLDKYFKLLEDARKSLSIPVIPSINCREDGTWMEYAKRFETVGCDAIEFNQYIIASDARLDAKDIEEKYLRLAKSAKKTLNVPVALKVGNRFSSLANFIKTLDGEGLDAMVLFNRFYSTDIDLETMKFRGAGALSDSNDYLESLRWIAMMSGEVRMDFCANTGIHSGETVIKEILAGASAVEVCSVLSKQGFGAVKTMLDDISSWMDRKGYETVADFKGLLSQESVRKDRIKNPNEWERSQYIKRLVTTEI